jgi:hypothetical protein
MQRDRASATDLGERIARAVTPEHRRLAVAAKRLVDRALKAADVRHPVDVLGSLIHTTVPLFAHLCLMCS